MKFSTALYYFLLLLPCAAFVEGYRFTEIYFKKKMIPFPFENFGLVAATGCFFWVLGFVALVWTVGENINQKRRKTS